MIQLFNADVFNAIIISHVAYNAQLLKSGQYKNKMRQIQDIEMVDLSQYTAYVRANSRHV